MKVILKHNLKKEISNWPLFSSCILLRSFSKSGIFNWKEEMSKCKNVWINSGNKLTGKIGAKLFGKSLTRKLSKQVSILRAWQIMQEFKPLLSVSLEFQSTQASIKVPSQRLFTSTKNIKWPFFVSNPHRYNFFPQSLHYQIALTHHKQSQYFYLNSN